MISEACASIRIHDLAKKERIALLFQRAFFSSSHTYSSRATDQRLEHFGMHEKRDVSHDEPAACSSRVHFSDSSYTLGFGQLFSGDLCSDVSVDAQRTACLTNHPRPRDTSIDGRVNEAMATMRRTRNNVFQHSALFLSMPPTSPHQNTLDGNTCRQAGITKAAEMLERAAHVIAAAANASNNRCQ